MISSSSKKTGKKEFFKIDIPFTTAKIFVLARSIEELNNKNAKIDLTRYMRGKNLEMKVKIKVQGEKIKSEPISLYLTTSYVKKIVRRGTDYVEDSFELNCRDRKTIIKPLLVTRNKVSRAVRNSLRKATKKYIENHCKNITALEVVSEILSNKLQKALSLKLKKIYPLALCDIRVFDIKEETKSKEPEIKESPSQE